MENRLIIQKVNDVFIKINCSDAIASELRDHFTFTVPNYQYNPKFKAGVWDGLIRLYHIRTGQIYAGLTKEIEKFCDEKKYQYDYAYDNNAFEWSVLEAGQFISSLKLPVKPYEEQVKTLIYGVRNSRALFVSPTASGKSLMIYMLVRFYSLPTLIIVPTITLVHQMKGDFVDYGIKNPHSIHLIYEGQDINTLAPITISTWQSIYKLNSTWFSKFRLIIGDECHLFKATSLKAIMENLTETPMRFGFTGTLDGTETNQLVLEGLFGPVKLVTTTKELIDKGTLSKLNIKIIILKHPTENCRLLYGKEWQDELDYLFSYEPRNRFIKNLALSLNGNTLLLFQRIDKHGKILYDMICKEAIDRKVFFVHGGVAGDERNQIRAIVEKETNAIVIASEGTFSTGINIKNLHNGIKSASSKGRIRNLQSIGRGLRLGSDKSEFNWFDIADDMKYKGKNNTTLNHLLERVKIYNKEGLGYKTYRVGLK
jgi:superfamily II DNA or RNA helicase